MLPPKFTPQDIIGVDIFLEKFQTRVHVGSLKRIENQFVFVYEKSYLKAKNVIPLGPELPLTQAKFTSKELFPSFIDRLPDPHNPAYPDYCKAAGISTEISDPIILLPTIGKRGPSSFIFEPIYKETINFKTIEKFREQLGLSMQDFAHVFDVSLSILQKIKAGETSGKEVLKRLAHYIYFPEALVFQLRQNQKWLHMEKLDMTQRLEVLFAEIFTDDSSFSLNNAMDITRQIEMCYMLLPYTHLKSEGSKYFNQYRKRFYTEVKPIIHVANYLKSIDNEPENICFCSTNEPLSHDGVLQWKDKEIRLEITRAIGGEKGGLNERLARELLTEQGWAPFGQPVEYSGDKHNREFGENRPKVVADRHKEEIPTRLLKAFKQKNKEKYQECWLILTVPTYWIRERFFDACAEFWKNARAQKPMYLERIFIISEEFINSEPVESVTSLEDSIWDSWNEEHQLKFLLNLFITGFISSNKHISEISFNSENGKKLRDLLRKTPRIFFTKDKNYDYLRYTTLWLKEKSSEIAMEDETEFLELFDKIASCTITIPSKEKLEYPTQIIFNHPIGHLTLALLERIYKHTEFKDGIIPDIKSRLTSLLKESNPARLISILAITWQLNWLHEKDPKWVKENVIRYFKWGDNQPVQYVWEMFIWSSYDVNINNELFNEIKTDLLKAIKQLTPTGQYTYQYACYLFIKTCLYKNDFSEEECTQLLENLSPEQLGKMAFAIFQVITKEKDTKKRAELWDTKIDGWIKKVWPKDQKLVTPAVSDALVRTILCIGSAFGNAEKTLSDLGLLTASKDLNILLRESLEYAVHRKFPDETLDLLARIVSPRLKTMTAGLFVQSNKEKLDNILSAIAHNFPQLVNSENYLQLANYLKPEMMT